MTTKSTRQAPAGRPDPVPEQRPWLTAEDAAGWRTAYVGDGRRREVKSRMVLELSDEQWDWLEEAAEAAGLDEFALVRKLIDDARAAAARRSRRAKKKAG
ncbi:MAG TPA: hypothetical protein VG370_08840 [Chloroflexota bacterium]|jgi:hypothetical protein|nr:hypothetical protein [Chloroflexota bacterium]